MAGKSDSDAPLLDILRLLQAHWLRWLLPTAVIGAASVAYAWNKLDVWEVTQGILVHDDAWIREEASGTFRIQDPLKTAQETIHEICRGDKVLSAALAQVGPPENWQGTGTWPNAAAVEQLRDDTSLDPPKGAEFGTTEVLYLKVQDSQAARARALVDAIVFHLRDELTRVRGIRQNSAILEFREVARHLDRELADATGRLTEMEQAAGADLAELRMLHASASNSGELVNSITSTENELTKLRGDRVAFEQSIALLEEARKNPHALLKAPAQLLAAHANLSQLTTGLVAAKLQAATVASTHGEDHPRYAAAAKQEQATVEKIHAELETTLANARSSIELLDGRVAVLENELGDLRRRMERLAALRATYSNLVAHVEDRRAARDRTQQNLDSLLAKQAVVNETRIVQMLNEPRVGAHPIGPSRAMIVAAGLLGGLFSGIGLVLLTAPGAPSPPPPMVESREVPSLRISDEHGFTRHAAGRRRPPPRLRSPANGRTHDRARDH